jgi:ribonucleoside-diphosphate reductase alpha chain
MSLLNYTHATPTLFNACLTKNQLSSCMLLSNSEDSIEGIYDTFKQCSILGAASAGVGLSVANIRSEGSLIKTTGSKSRGIPSFLTVYDINSVVIDQGGKRSMSIAIYVPVWHADFMTVLEMKSNNQSNLRTKHLFYAVWSNNLLYKRAMAGEMWSFFSPDECPKLLNTYGIEFEKVYEEYECNKSLIKFQLPATNIYEKIATIMVETGGPYHLNADACNFKSNMKNVATINCSNLCAEILIPSGKIDGHEEIGVCTLASISLPMFCTPVEYNQDGSVKTQGSFDFDRLHTIAGNCCKNLNQVIDRQLYPVEACKRSNLRHRPIGVGVQGLADVFMMLNLPYESNEAKELNWRIYEEIYHGALMASMQLAEEDGEYETFNGSPASQGILQPHLWRMYAQQFNCRFTELKYKYDWDLMGKEVSRRGLRNALLLTAMPTASTSQILGNSSSFEPYNAMIFSRHTQAGIFTILNKHLVRVLTCMGLWNDVMKDRIIMANGSLRDVHEIPDSLKSVFKTCWEMKQKTLMDMSADRGQFICQTQSLNIFIENPNVKVITSVIIYGMSIGLKTISYYTRSRPAVDPIKITIPSNLQNKSNVKLIERIEEDVCTSCMA